MTISPLPRKVLHILSGATGGAPLSTMELMEAASDAGIQSCAVCHDLGCSEDRQRLLELTNGQVIFTPLYWWNRKVRTSPWKRPLSQLKQLIRTGGGFGSTAKVTAAIKTWKPDLVHSNTILTLEGGWASRRCGLPHVWHLRELVGPGQPFRFYREGPSWGRYVARMCDRIIANARGTADKIISWAPAGLIEVVPNGINLKSFVPRSRNWQSNRIVVGMVATLKSHCKRHDLFIEAAARVDRRLPIEWRIYGEDPSNDGSNRDDPYVNRLHDLINKYGLRQHFSFPGHKGSPATIMQEIDLLVHPTDQESFGRVIVEAMAAALPTIGVARGGSREIIVNDETGLLAAPESAEELAFCIERIARNPELAQRLGMAGRRRAELCYSRDACAAGVMHIYAKVLQQAR
jgi:glycosyltransferase involved in cell wall biosynthesis